METSHTTVCVQVKGVRTEPFEASLEEERTGLGKRSSRHRMNPLLGVKPEAQEPSSPPETG